MTMVAMRLGLVILVSCCLVAEMAAGPVEVNLVPVDNSAGGAELEGFTTTDVVLTIRGLYVGSQMLIELDQGTIYQHPEGGHMAPNPGLVGLFPALEFDTYVANGSHSTNGPYDPFLIIGAAANLLDAGSRPLAFDDAIVDIAWAATPGNTPSHADNFITSRVTLSDDASGRWLYLASGGGQWTVIAPDDHPIHDGPGAPLVVAGSGTIRSGQLQLLARVPEPRTLGLIAAAALIGWPLIGRRAELRRGR